MLDIRFKVKKIHINDVLIITNYFNLIIYCKKILICNITFSIFTPLIKVLLGPVWNPLSTHACVSLDNLTLPEKSASVQAFFYALTEKHINIIKIIWVQFPFFTQQFSDQGGFCSSFQHFYPVKGLKKRDSGGKHSVICH